MVENGEWKAGDFAILSAFFYRPISTFYFFNSFNPSTSLLNAPSVRSTGVA